MRKPATQALILVQLVLGLVWTVGMFNISWAIYVLTGSSWSGLGELGNYILLMLAGPLLLTASSTALARDWPGRRVYAAIGIVASIETLVMTRMWYAGAVNFFKSRGEGPPPLVVGLTIVMGASIVASIVLFGLVSRPTVVRS